MSIAVARKLQIDHRVAEQQARATIKDNPILALVELITNCDDSYRRIENRGQKADGRVFIELVRKYEGSIFRVIDYAEGFDGALMDERVGGYGGDTSGFTSELAGRGYWGRGLKEAMINFGFGAVDSVKDDQFYKCVLEGLDYKRTNPVQVTKPLRKQLEVINNGTFVDLKATNTRIRIPQYDTLRRSLAHFYSLRDIVTGNNRIVQLIEKDSRGRVKRQDRLTYNFPKGEIVVNKELEIPEYKGARVALKLYRASEPLSGWDDEGPLRENGILIRSKGAIVDITLTRKFEGNTYASRLFGHATCDYIDYLLREKKEPIIRSDRAGLDWTHLFCKALEQMLSKEVEAFVKDEEKRSRDTQKQLESEKTKKRYESSLPELNKIAQEELGKEGGGGPGPGPGNPPVPPPNGFDFLPDYYQVVVDEESTLTIKALVPSGLVKGSKISISSATKELVVTDKELVVSDKNIVDGLWTGRVHISGHQVGTEGIITAKSSGKIAEALIKVISKKKVSPPPSPKERGGLFKGYEFSSQAEPHQRVKFNRASGKIVIATRAPSVEMYFGPEGQGQEEGHCQVLLAELVIEAVCREIARQRIETGKEPFLGEAAEAVNVVHNRLINKYANKIHDMLVEVKYRRLK